MLSQQLCAILIAVAPLVQAAPVSGESKLLGGTKISNANDLPVENKAAELDARYIYTQATPDGSETKRDAELDARYIYTQSTPDGSETKRDAELDARYIYTQATPDGSETKRSEDDAVFHPLE
ncbi:gram-positive signal ysirk family [Colletotrichum truncatum]|uniref:Gram-positive signal ysirk family n=1 Tax=Colletotrichum truncatum TaxID=5467 RepID=A0ACC3YIW6_COLTU|nr:gram-positive signal ysirk family [Colletotrichum truncatum]KAF6797086.1 gram-positive signal ysirk family [Colletotrichum truncatum]